MEPTSSPDNARPARDDDRFRSGPLDGEGAAAAPVPAEHDGTRTSETEVFALGSRVAPGSPEFSFPAFATTVASTVTGTVTGAGATPFAAFASTRGPGSGPTPPPGPEGHGGQQHGGQQGGHQGGQQGWGPRRPGPRPGGKGPFELRPAAPSGDTDHSAPSEEEPGLPQPVESPRINPWDRDSGTFGGFGLGGRNGRFLFGGRDPAENGPNGAAHPEPADAGPADTGPAGNGTNGHHAEHANGAAPVPDGDDDERRPEPEAVGPALDETARAPGEVLDEPGPRPPAQAEAAPEQAEAERSDENGDDDMNGRAGVPGFPPAGDPAATEETPDGRRRDLSDAEEPRGQATGWASVPTSKNPVVGPVSGVPTSGLPVASGLPVTSGLPVSAVPVSPGYPAYGQPPAYVPGLPDPSAGPVSGVPAPRSAPQIPNGQIPNGQNPNGQLLNDQFPNDQFANDQQLDDAESAEEQGPAGRGLSGFRPRGAGFGTVDVTFGAPLGKAAVADESAVDEDEAPRKPDTLETLEKLEESERAEEPVVDAIIETEEPEPETDDVPEPAALVTPAPPAASTPIGAAQINTAQISPAQLSAAQVSPTPISAAPAQASGAVLGSSMTAGPALFDNRRPWEIDAPALAASAPRRSASLEDVEPVRRGRRAAPDEELPEETGLRPGDVAEGHIAFWDEDATRHFRAAWHEVKAEFVDDPVAALTRAHDLLTDAVNELTESLLAERDELDPLRGTATPDTESMRMAMRGYREFLERILAL